MAGPLSDDTVRRFRELTPYTLHNIEIEKGLRTVPDWQHGYPCEDDLRALATLDRAGGTLRGKRVIDLGCLEGGFTVAFARWGAKEAVGVDSRELNIRRCNLVKEALDLPNLRYVQADVREVTRETFGMFDIVFFCGLLYHLEDPFAALANAFEMCGEFLVLDTHVAIPGVKKKDQIGDIVKVRFREVEYEGKYIQEFPPGVTQEEVESSLLASYGNLRSLWLTEDSLVRLLAELGCRDISRVYSCKWDNYWVPQEDRILLLARKYRSYGCGSAPRPAGIWKKWAGRVRALIGG